MNKFYNVVNRNERFALLNLSSAEMKIGFWMSTSYIQFDSAHVKVWRLNRALERQP